MKIKSASAKNKRWANNENLETDVTNIDDIDELRVKEKTNWTIGSKQYDNITNGANYWIIQLYKPFKQLTVKFHFNQPTINLSIQNYKKKISRLK